MSETPSGWYGDPLGRYDHRYWDGTDWTEHVSRDGVQAVDALDGSAPPVTAAGPARQTAPRPEGELSTKAVLSLVLSVIALPAGFVLIGPLLAIAGIVLGVSARREIRASGGQQRGDGIALAGIIVGVGTLVLTLLAFAAVAAFFVGGFGMMGESVRFVEETGIVLP